MGSRYLCKHDLSDDDCYKCAIHGYMRKGECSLCPDFEDMRAEMPEDILALREKIMRENGLTDEE